MTRLMVLGALLLAACGSEPVGPVNAVVDLAEPWRLASVEDVGGDNDLVNDAIALGANQPRLLSLVAVRNGQLVVEEYFNGANRSTLLDVRSVTKSIVSALTGIAISEGLIAHEGVRIVDLVDTTVVPLSGLQREITVDHLLTMTGGFAWQESGGPEYGQWITSPDQLTYLLDKPMDDQPGTDFEYNSAAVFLLGVVLEQVSGMTLEDYAELKLFGPLGIDDWRWETTNRGNANGGSGIDLRARDLARFGQFLLQDGMSNANRRILPTAWAGTSTNPRFTWNFAFGPLQGVSYGNLWWTVRGEPELGFFAWGWGGQFVYVAPELALVMVATTNWAGMSADGGPRPFEEAVMTILVDHLLPAFR